MDTKGKRLRWARERAGYKSARSAALDMDLKVGTYNSHERAGEPGSRDYDDEAARRYARRYRVSLMWLLTGEGQANRSTTVDIVGRVGLGEAIEWSEEGDLALGEVQLPIPLPEGCFALEARGSSQYPRVKDGEVVIAKWAERDAAEMVGYEAVVKIEDGPFLLKTIRRATSDGAVILGSHNAEDMEPVIVERVAEVMMIVPSKGWTRIAGQ